VLAQRQTHDGAWLTSELNRSIFEPRQGFPDAREEPGSDSQASEAVAVVVEERAQEAPRAPGGVANGVDGAAVVACYVSVRPSLDGAEKDHPAVGGLESGEGGENPDAQARSLVACDGLLGGGIGCLLGGGFRFLFLAG
jgi:hypothetical protein